MPQGPKFKIKLELHNQGERTLTNVPVAFAYDRNIYSMERGQFIVSALLPVGGLGYQGGKNRPEENVRRRSLALSSSLACSPKTVSFYGSEDVAVGLQKGKPVRCCPSILCLVYVLNNERQLCKK